MKLRGVLPHKTSRKLLRMGINADERAEPKLDCKEHPLLKFSGTLDSRDWSASNRANTSGFSGGLGPRALPALPWR